MSRLALTLPLHCSGSERLSSIASHSGFSLSGAPKDIILKPDTRTLTIQVGQSATFRCSVRGGDLKDYQMSWYKKNEDNALVLVYKLSNNSNNNLRNDFKGDMNILNNQYILEISKTTTKDIGTYYCGSDIHGAAVTVPHCLRTSQTTVADPIRDLLAKMCITLQMRPPDKLNSNLIKETGLELRPGSHLCTQLRWAFFIRQEEKKR